MSSTPSKTVQTLNEIVDPFGVYCALELRFPSDAQGPRSGSLFHVFPVMPESMRVAQRYLQTITPTQGGVFIDEFGRAPSPVILQGTFGRSPNIDIRNVVDSLSRNYQALTGTAFEGTTTNSGGYDGAAAKFSASTDQVGTEKQKGGPVTGYKLVRLLSQMVEWSHQPFGPSGKCPQVFFYNFAFGQFHEVALNSFQAQMNVEANGLWTYQLEMTTLRQLGADLQQIQRNAAADKALESLLTAPAVAAGVASPNRWAQRLNKVTNLRNSVLKVTGMLNSLRGADLINMALSSLNKTLGFPPGTLGNFYQTIRSLPQLIDEVGQALGAPKRLFRELVNEFTSLAASVRSSAAVFSSRAEDAVNFDNALVQTQFTPSLVTVVPLDSSSWNGDRSSEVDARDEIMELNEAALSAEDSIRQLEVLALLRGLDDFAPSNPASTAPDQFEAAVSASAEEYQVRQGDTLSSIAVAMYGTVDSWPLVAQLLPESMRTVSPNAPLDAYVGQSIVVPQGTNIVTDLVPYVWDRPVGQAAMGRDLPSQFTTQTRSDGTVALTAMAEQNTLLQGIAQRITLPMGASVDTPSFGSPLYSMAGQSFGILQSEMNRAFVQEAVARDPRIREVTRVEVGSSGDTYVVQFSAVAANNVRLEEDELVLSLS